MEFEVLLILRFFLLVAISAASGTVSVPGYTAAVLEHEFLESERCSAIEDGHERATCVKLENLDVYEEKTKEAARQGAEIIVFPESGIHGGAVTNRLATSQFAETILDPTTGWLPCDDIALNRTVQYRLSCMAKDNQLYVVGNSIDRKTERAGVSGEYFYNTAIAYDPRGVLVARYHKLNLFDSERLIYDRPAEAEISYFDTHFGRVGLFVCFDVLFRQPAYELIENHQVTEVAFPTAWIDELPMWSSVGVHASFSMTMGVNFLSANYRRVKSRMLGSGIYSPDGPLIWTRNETESGSILLVTWVPKRHQHSHPSVYFSDIFFGDVYNTSQSYLFHDLYTFTTLESGSHRKKVCMNTFCCKLKYTATIDSSETYALGVFSGMHTKAQQHLYMQNCVVTKCADLESSSCGQSVARARSKFDYFHLEGNFVAKYIFSQVVKDNVQLARMGEYEMMLEGDAYILSRNGFEEPLLFSALAGRIYNATSPVYEDEPMPLM